MSDKNDKAPDKVTHRTEFVLGHKPTVDVTEIQKGEKTYTGYGWDRKEADENAGKKYNDDKPDGNKK